MRESTHVPAAAMLVLWLGIINPVEAFGLGLASHLLLDTGPHMDPGDWFEPKEDGTRHLIQEARWQEKIPLAADLLSMVGIGLWILFTHKPTLPLTCGMFGAILPDLLIPKTIQDWVRERKWIAWFDRLHQRFHFSIIEEQRRLSHHWEISLCVYSLWWLAHN